MTEHMDRFARETADKLDKGLHRQTMGDETLFTKDAVGGMVADLLAERDRLRAEHAEMAAALRKIAEEWPTTWPGVEAQRAVDALARIQGEAPQEYPDDGHTEDAEKWAEDFTARIQGEAP